VWCQETGLSQIRMCMREVSGADAGVADGEAGFLAAPDPPKKSKRVLSASATPDNAPD